MLGFIHCIHVLPFTNIPEIIIRAQDMTRYCEVNRVLHANEKQHLLLLCDFVSVNSGHFTSITVSLNGVYLLSFDATVWLPQTILLLPLHLSCSNMFNNIAISAQNTDVPRNTSH